MTDKAASLPALAERVEALTGRCEETDARIRHAVYAPAETWVEQSRFNGAWCVMRKDFRDRDALWEGEGRGKAFTASIDAAITLVPEGEEWDWELYKDGFVTVFQRTKTKLQWWQTSAATPALALTAAALRAIAAMGDA